MAAEDAAAAAAATAAPAKEPLLLLALRLLPVQHLLLVRLVPLRRWRMRRKAMLPKGSGQK